MQPSGYTNNNNNNNQGRGGYNPGGRQGGGYRGGRGGRGSGGPPQPPPQRHHQQQQQPVRPNNNHPPGQVLPSGRGPIQQQQGPVGIAPTTGIPYGYVPAFLPGSSSLVEELDKPLLMVLRDGRNLVGYLRSFDQFSNLVLEETVERKIHKHKDGATYYADLDIGLNIVRGDAMVLVGQVQAKEDNSMTKVEWDELEDMINNNNDDGLAWDFDKDLLA